MVYEIVLCNIFFSICTDIEFFFRPALGNGLWTCALLPAILIFYDYIYKVSPLYRLMTCISIGLFTYSILYLFFFYVSCLVLRDTINAGCLSAAFLSALPIYLRLEQSKFTSDVKFTIIVVFLFQNILLSHYIESHLPKVGQL